MLRYAIRVFGGRHTTAVLSEAWAKLCDWASVTGRGQLLLSGSVAHASLKTAVDDKSTEYRPRGKFENVLNPLRWQRLV